MSKRASQAAKPKSTYEQFGGMMSWMMEGMEKNPKNDAEMFAQSSKASIRTMILSGWILGKLLRFILKIIKEGLRMVFGRKKKEDKNDPSFVSPMAAQQMAAFNQQIQQGGYPFQQQTMQQPIQAYPYQQQPMCVPPAPPMQQPVQQPMVPVQRPALQPVPLQPGAGQSVLEQLMLADMCLAEHLKDFNTRLLAIETYLQTLGQQVDQLNERLNLVQGVQPSGGKKTKFQKQ